MDDTINVMLIKNTFQRRLIANIDRIKREITARQFFYALNGLSLGVDQIIGDDHLMASAQQLQAGMGADIAGASCD